MKRRTFLSLMGAAALTSGMMLTGCGAGSDKDDRKIIRIGHVQSQTHPDHLGLVAFADHINEKLGDKYRVEVYPSELLGSQTEMVQLTQTGAIDFVVASTAIMETFSSKYQIFNLPYLFSSVEAYHAAMDDPEVTAVALPALRYQCVAMFLQPVIIVTNMMFQSIGKSGRATFLACCRQGVCFIPLILTLPRIWGLSGIELCQPIADGLTFCISVPFLLPFLKELKEQGDEE